MCHIGEFSANGATEYRQEASFGHNKIQGVLFVPFEFNLEIHFRVVFAAKKYSDLMPGDIINNISEIYQSGE